MSGPQAPALPEVAIWHDVECGAYGSDLEIWRQLGDERGGPILELGAGTGRVALALAHAGHDVVAVERDEALAEVLRERAEGALEVITADACELNLHRAFALVIAPMQFLQIIGGKPERAAVLARIAQHLTPGGLGAAAIVDSPPEGEVAEGEPIPDVRELDGWVFSSLPVAVQSVAGGLEAVRLRQRVSPTGALDEHTHVDHLTTVSAMELDAEASDAGLLPLPRLLIPANEAFVGSTVCLWSRR